MWLYLKLTIDKSVPWYAINEDKHVLFRKGHSRKDLYRYDRNNVLYDLYFYSGFYYAYHFLRFWSKADLVKVIITTILTILFWTKYSSTVYHSQSVTEVEFKTAAWGTSLRHQLMYLYDLLKGNHVVLTVSRLNKILYISNCREKQWKMKDRRVLGRW